MLNYRRQQGIGLLELMLALAIIASIIVAATRYFGTASRAAKVTVALEQLRTVNKAD